MIKDLPLLTDYDKVVLLLMRKPETTVSLGFTQKISLPLTSVNGQINSFDAMGFALGIVRVQYQFFIGTAAKRSPEKPDPGAAWGTPKLLYSF